MCLAPDWIIDTSTSKNAAPFEDVSPPSEATLYCCWDCGLLQQCNVGSHGDVQCARCSALLNRRHPRSADAAGLGAGIGLVLLAFGLSLPLATITLPGGRFAQIDLPGIFIRSGAAGAWWLVLAASAPLIVLPALKMGSVFAFWLSLRTSRSSRFSRWLGKAFTLANPLAAWAMLDVFLLGAMVALFRMRSWGDVELGPGLGALAAAACCSLLIDVLKDPEHFWSPVAPNLSPNETQAPTRTTACPHCGLVQGRTEPIHAEEELQCRRCHREFSHRKRQSLNRATALASAGLLLLLPANILPVMTITKLGRGGSGTIWHGIVQLGKDGFWGLALIVFVASLLIPIFKLLATSYLVFSTRKRSREFLLPRTRLYRFLVIVGRWSMIDIFATLTLVGLAQFGFLGQVLPASGALWFCAVVFITMWAVEAFDPRLMWDDARKPVLGEAPR